MDAEGCSHPALLAVSASLSGLSPRRHGLRSPSFLIPQRGRPMAITMYSGFVPVCLQLHGGLKTVLKKAEEHATAQKWDTTVVLNLRLFPDMFPLERQVRQGCTHSPGAGPGARGVVR